MIKTNSPLPPPLISPFQKLSTCNSFSWFFWYLFPNIKVMFVLLFTDFFLLVLGITSQLLNEDENLVLSLTMLIIHTHDPDTYFCFRISQHRHYWHLGLDNSLLWGVVLCTASLSASLAPTYYILAYPNPRYDYQISTDIIKCPHGDKISRG